MIFKTVPSIWLFLIGNLSPCSWRWSDWLFLAVPSSQAISCTHALSCYVHSPTAVISMRAFSPFRCLSAPCFLTSSQAWGTWMINLRVYQNWAWILVESILPFSRNLALISSSLLSSLRGHWFLSFFSRQGPSGLLCLLAFPSLFFMIICIFPA